MQLFVSFIANWFANVALMKPWYVCMSIG